MAKLIHIDNNGNPVEITGGSCNCGITQNTINSIIQSLVSLENTVNSLVNGGSGNGGSGNGGSGN
jgi:hypothetical protein